MTTTTIPAGYRITFNSSEGDSDYHKTIMHEGVSLEKVKFLVEVSQLFAVGGEYRDLPDYVDEEELAKAQKAIQKLAKQYRSALSDEDYESIMEEAKYYVADNILGKSDSLHFRTLDSFKIEEVPHDIVLKDMTAKFHKSAKKTTKRKMR